MFLQKIPVANILDVWNCKVFESVRGFTAEQSSILYRISLYKTLSSE